MYFKDEFNAKSYLNIVKKIAEEKYIYESDKLERNRTNGLNFLYEINSQINARTRFISEQNKDMICINTGVVVELFAYIFSVFASPYYFKEIGNCKKEKGRLITGKFIDGDNKKIIYNGEPIDPIRKKAAFMTCILATRFILMHEMGHIFNGHVFFLKKEYGIDELLMNEDDKDIQKALLRRTLEMDADAMASTDGFDNVFTQFNQKLPAAIGINNFEIFYIWSFAVHSIFLLFEYKSDKKYTPNSSYLPNVSRSILQHNIVFECLDEYVNTRRFRRYKPDVECIKKYYYKGIREAEKYFNDRFNEEYDIFEMYQRNDLYKKTIEEVNSYWDNVVYKKLIPYSRAKLYEKNNRDLFKEMLGEK